MESSRSRVPLRVPVYLALLHLATLAGLVLTARRPALPDLVGLLVIVACAAFNVEAGRRVEGGRALEDRPHKGLSAWPFAAALLLPAGCALLVVVPVYWHARVRGLKLPLWKWVGSGEAVGLAALAAHHAHRAASPTGDLTVLDQGPQSLLAVGLAGLVFVATEAVLLGIVAMLDTSGGSDPLRRHLSSRDFYTTELSVLATGAVAAVLLSVSPWLLVLELPAYAVLQRAVLHESLRHRAETDPKTALLNSDAWRREARRSLRRAAAETLPAAVLLVDLDHFKHVNDTHGHLAGDEVLVGVARLLRDVLRPGDVIGRFGGEEFCVLLPGAGGVSGSTAGERIRAAVSAMRWSQPELRVTVSVGVCEIEPDVVLEEGLDAADRALYAAKSAGRDRVVCATTVDRRAYRPSMLAAV